ncbi:MAG: hypothetical protein AAGB11_00975 [Pseudomonadota bacterium]
MDLAFFIPACFAIHVAFGLNNLLALTHGMERGPWGSLAAGAGKLLLGSGLGRISTLQNCSGPA